MITSTNFKIIEKTIKEKHNFIKLLFVNFEEFFNKNFIRIKNDVEDSYNCYYLSTNKTILKNDLIKIRREISELIKLIDEKM